MESIFYFFLQRYPFDKERGSLIKPIAVLREREACVFVCVCVNKASLAALGRVGRRRLKLIGNVIVGRKSFAAVLHLREQLQSLLLLLGGVVAQEVRGRGEDGGSAGPRYQVEADGEGDVYEGAVVLFVLLLQRQDELRGPVAEAYDCGALQH